jgi:hypothetical protein
MSIKKAYYYLFYKFYKLAKVSPSIFPSDFVAILCLFWIELILLFDLKMYYRRFIDPNDDFVIVSLQTLIPVAILFLMKYFAFIQNTKWKKFVKEFDQLPVGKNDRGTLLTIGIVIFVFGNLMLAVYLSPGRR